MRFIHALFNWASDVYGDVFADWMIIHFAVRTVVLLLLFWASLYLITQIIRFALAPLIILFYYHVIVRFVNFFILETLNEWIYIHYYSNEKPFLGRVYLRLTDFIKHNRSKLLNATYAGLLYRGRIRRISSRLIYVAAITLSLWMIAFAIFQEYSAISNDTIVGTLGKSDEPDSSDRTETGSAGSSAESNEIPDSFTTDATEPETFDPGLFAEGDRIFFSLNEHGVDGANVRDQPGTRHSAVVDVVWGDAVLEYLGVYTNDTDDGGVFWLKVKTPNGTVGYISGTLLEVLSSDGS